MEMPSPTLYLISLEEPFKYAALSHQALVIIEGTLCRILLLPLVLSSLAMKLASTLKKLSLTFLAREANCSVERVSSMNCAAGVTQQIMAMVALPMRLFCSTSAACEAIPMHTMIRSTFQSGDSVTPPSTLEQIWKSESRCGAAVRCLQIWRPLQQAGRIPAHR